MTLIDQRRDMWKVLFDFQKLLDDDESKAAFEPIMKAFSNYDAKIKEIVDNPVRLENNFNFQDAPPSVEPTEMFITALNNNWIELENGDFINIDKIDFVSKEKCLLLFSSGKWSKPNTLTQKDLYKVRYALQSKRYQ